MQKRILIVAHDLSLLATRSSLLLKAGYSVSTTDKAESAIKLLKNNSFDLVLIGRNSVGLVRQIDEQLRVNFPHLLILKIAEASDQGLSYATKTTDSIPTNVLAALRAMLG